MFDMYLGDIINATVAKTPQAGSGLAIYEWKVDTTNHWRCEPVYVESVPDTQTGLLMNPAVSYNPTDARSCGFSVYNSLNQSVLLRVPPSPQFSSKYSLGKKAAAAAAPSKAWSIRVVPKNGGALLSSVCCAYNPAGGPGTTFLPMPPSFSNVAVGVCHAQTGVSNGIR